MLVFILWYQLWSVHCTYYGSNCCVAAVVCMTCEDVVLVYGCVGVFIVVSVVKRSLRVLWQQLLCSRGSMYGMWRCSACLFIMLVFLLCYLLWRVHCDNYGSNSCVAAVVCMKCEIIVLDYGCVGVFILVSFVERSIWVIWQLMLCSSGSVSCIWRRSVVLRMCWCFYCGICFEAFFVIIMSATAM